VVTLEDVHAAKEKSQEDAFLVDELLEKLKGLDERQARVVELRFFGGLTMEEIAEAMGISKRTAEGEWMMARAWLSREMKARTAESE
jgi:RNA polymerase sigma factor (sigma-70 family)